MALSQFEETRRERTVTGILRKGVHENNYYVELEISGLRWDVNPARRHLKLLNKRVCASGVEVAFKRLSVQGMTLVE
jgi:hypothetical protein